MSHLRRCFGFLFSLLFAVCVLSCASTGPDTGQQSSKKGRIVGRLGGPPDSGQSQALQHALSVIKQGISSVEGVVIKLVDPESGEAQAQATSQADGSFVFENVPVGQYKLAIEQDEFSEVAYAVDTELLQVTANSTLSVGLPVVKRVFLPAYPQPTTGSPVTLDQSSGRVYMAVDQGLLVLHSKNDTVDLLYTADGFRSEKGPRLLHFVEQQNTLLIITPSKCWIIDEQIFEDDTASEVINYDDPATREALGNKVSSFDLDAQGDFIDTSRRGEDFDPHYYRFDTTTDGSWLYLAAGDQAAVIDWVNKEVKRIFLSSGRLAHYSSASNRLFFLQEPNTIRLIDAETLLEVANYDLSEDNPTALLGVSSRPSNGNGYVSYTRLNINNEHIPFLLIVDPSGNVVANDQASTLLGATDSPMEPGVPHWQAGGERFIMGDSLFQFDGTSFQPVATGVVLNSSLSGNGVLSNKFRSADVPNSILISYLGDENAALGFYFLSGSNPNVGIRVVRGRVPTVTVDEIHGRGIVFGDGAMSIIYYNATDASSAEAEVDLSAVGGSLLGGASGTACSSSEPCPEGGVCVPVDEFNTDEGTCNSQVYNPYRRFCGGISAVQCDPGFECNYHNATNPQSAGECIPQACSGENGCPEGFYCEWSSCPPDDEKCQQQDSQGICICPDLTQCGPSCSSDLDCPDGHLCSGTGHCAVDRCLDDSSCPEGKVCGVTEQGRTCVEAGIGQIGDPCISSSECASAYCRAGVCEQSCSKTSDCPVGQECQADDWAGFCAQASCGCGPEEICRYGQCDTGANCVEDSDCGPQSLCADGRCRSSCSLTSDCGPDEVCVQGPPHIYGLFCVLQEESWCYQNNQIGCPSDSWCSESGMCQTGQACRDWEPDSCPQDQLCIQNACQSTCTSNSQCQPEEECTGGMNAWIHTPEGEKAVMTCQPASCHCPISTDLCINNDSFQLGQCWNWNDCTQDGLCPDGYRCEHSVEWEIYRCQCENQEICGSRCINDDNCPQYNRCELESGACMMDYCEDDAQCQEGKVCGYLEWTGRICITPGTRLPGAPCDQSEQCTTGACMESQNGRMCVEICSTTGDCHPDQLCGFSEMHDQEGGRICWTPSDGSMCTLDEYEVGAQWQHQCSDGTSCEQEGGCAWPTSCAWMPYGSVCVCSDPVCNQHCATDDECGQASLGCTDGLCRLKAACSSDEDCAPDKVCGFIDENEALGPRCVAPGNTADQGECVSHADCMSGLCAVGLCARTCSKTDDCDAGDECQAVIVGASKVLGICSTEVCNCGPEEVCNLEGSCGPGPLCNQDDECQQGQVCAYHHCRNACQKTSDCGPNEDCTGISASQPHACLAASCNCSADQVCDGDACWEARPCNSDVDCNGGRCLAGQCQTQCSATSECEEGLECVAVSVENDMTSQGHMMVRLCTTPSCSCADPDSWCMISSGSGWPMGCWQGDDCQSCENDQWQMCYGIDLEDSMGQACYNGCQEDQDCPQGSVCGYNWDGHVGCYYPGTLAVGEDCSQPNECASGSCVEGICIEACQVTADCGPDQNCGMGWLPPHLAEWGVRVCYDQSNVTCLDDEFEIEGSCSDGTECQDSNCIWPTTCKGFASMQLCVCDDPICRQSCSDDSQCSGELLVCEQNLCRPRTACQSDQDCADGRICGLVDGAESAGPRCVTPGDTQTGFECQSHADCQSGFCALGICSLTCNVSSDCPGSQECQAAAVGSGSVLGTCQDPVCGCASDEVCNLSGICGSGPLCNADEHCGASEACADNLCRPKCQTTADCESTEDCTGPGGARPHVCLAKTCDCAGTQVCEGGQCFEAKPCQDDTNCMGGRCVGGQCYDPCYTTSQCDAGLECVAVRTNEWDQQRYRLCVAPVCSCPDSEHWCLADSSEAPLGCYHQDECSGGCTDDERCQWFGGVDQVGSACYAVCSVDQDCPAQTVCGLSGQERGCYKPGLGIAGDSCGYAGDCASGWCADGTCIEPCQTTSDCPADQVCGQGFLPDYMLPNIRTCWTPDDGLRCAGSEFEVQHQCTDGTYCGAGQDSACLWPTSCNHTYPGLELCVCSAPECFYECVEDAECNSEFLSCQEGLCRERPSCNSNADCASDQVCGFLDGNEERGLVCVLPGPNTAGQACENHSDCASATCAGTCIDRCVISDDCPVDQECQAVQVGQAGLVLGACQAISCDCGIDEVCNLDGSCGPGPLCNSQSDCQEGFACVTHFCRALCQKTADCQSTEDCTGPGAGLPHVCLEASCNCADNQVCEGDLCFEARPCASDQDCSGRCVSGQCYDSCSANGDCPAGLECVAISYNPEFLNQKALLCAAPSCGCADTEWCLADTLLGGAYPPGCYYNASMCQCDAGDTCRWVPVEDLMEGACYRTCSDDIDCMDSAVCGRSDSGYECVYPGSKLEGESCSYPNECASATCIWGQCINSCMSGLECESGQVCSFNNPNLPGDIAICVDQAQSQCPDGCADDEWCANGSCHSGTACWYNDQVCADNQICDGYACSQECQNSNDCSESEECIVIDDIWNPLASRKVCRDAACNCPNREDVCIDNDSDRRCIRPVACNFANTCEAQLGAGSGYECSSSLNYSCECTDSSLCGPWCLDHADCVQERVCDIQTKSCETIPCFTDSDCPSGTICPFYGSQRYCAQPGPMTTLEVGCDRWQDCQSGMCYQTMCVEPCINNADCAQAGETCQMAPGAQSWENFPFCFSWSSCGCADDQFCSDQNSQTCQTGPACSGHEDCDQGWCDESTTRTCQ